MHGRIVMLIRNHVVIQLLLGILLIKLIKSLQTD